MLPPAPGGQLARLGHQLVVQEASNWQEVSVAQAQLGDVLAFYDRRHGWHAAIFIDHRTMLHTEEGVDCVTERHDQLAWRNRLVGIYRHPRRG